MPTMYEKLLQLPLFQGLTLNDLTLILGKVKLRFESYQPGEEFISAGSECKRLYFVLDGTVQKTTAGKGEIPFRVQETFGPPYMVELFSLFGRETVYHSSYTAVDQVNTINFHKRFLTEELAAFPIIEMNSRNILSARIQGLHDRLWGTPPESAESLIANFLLNHVEKTEGEKVFHLAKTDLAKYIHQSLHKTETALASMQKQGLLSYERNMLILPEASDLLPLYGGGGL